MSSSATPAATTSPRTAANRANAKLSTGPKTEAGKANSARNATTHGLTSARAFVREGEEEYFKDFKAALEADIRPSPTSFLERYHFNRLVAAAWNMERCDRLQAEISSPKTFDPLLDQNCIDVVRQIEVYRRRNERSFLISARHIGQLQIEAELRRVISQDGRDLILSQAANRTGLLASIDNVRKLHAHLDKLPNPKPAPAPEPHPVETPAPPTPPDQPEAASNPPHHPPVGFVCSTAPSATPQDPEAQPESPSQEPRHHDTM